MIVIVPIVPAFCAKQQLGFSEVHQACFLRPVVFLMVLSCNFDDDWVCAVYG